MGRHGFSSTMRHIIRDMARVERARQIAANRAATAYQRSIQAVERQTKAAAKESARLYTQSRIEEAQEMSDAIQERDTAIAGLLENALKHPTRFEVLSQIKTFTTELFDETEWDERCPKQANYQPLPLSFIKRLMPGAIKKHEDLVLNKKNLYQIAHEQHTTERQSAYNQYLSAQDAKRVSINEYNAEILASHSRLLEGSYQEVVDFFSELFRRSLNGEPDALSAECGYSPESKHLVIDLDLPEISVIPDENLFKYIKSTDMITATARPQNKRHAAYSNLLCQIVLKAVDTVFRGSSNDIVACLTVNGMLETIDPATGQNIRVCLISVRVTEDVYQTFNLARVSPEQCLRSLRASVSRAPSELIPVKPIVEMSMIDPRFIENSDVIGFLDERPNLMELTPSEFEGLVTNLFEKMGLNTRQTRASRDGGVDCVAFDSRPIFGGKVVIQAKRYKNTVGVSAVRDLFGTVQNEGASKGILVTTSGFGKAAFEFAAGKPLELLEGSNLLYLLAEHANIEAKIVMPDDWTDKPLHGE